MTPQEEGLAALIAERIGALDRRIEAVGAGTLERLDRSDERHERHTAEIAARKDNEHRELWAGLSDVQRSIQMLKGAVAIIVVILLPFATVWFGHLLN